MKPALDLPVIQHIDTYSLGGGVFRIQAVGIGSIDYNANRDEIVQSHLSDDACNALVSAFKAAEGGLL